MTPPADQALIRAGNAGGASRHTRRQSCARCASQSTHVHRAGYPAAMKRLEQRPIPSRTAFEIRKGFSHPVPRRPPRSRLARARNQQQQHARPKSFSFESMLLAARLKTPAGAARVWGARPSADAHVQSIKSRDSFAVNLPVHIPARPQKTVALAPRPLSRAAARAGTHRSA
jgi:hypothetical protein